jgi:RNA polymerase sigma factor (sigma-70 family)
MFQDLIDDRFARGIIRRKVRQIIGRGAFPHHDAEDLEQELLLRLLRSFRHFDPAHGSHRNTFITTVVEREAALILRRRRAKKRMLGSVRSLAGSPRSDGDGDAWDLPGVPGPALEVAHDIAIILKSLPEDLRDLAERLKHHSIAEIARELQLPASTIQRRRERLRQFFTAP